MPAHADAPISWRYLFVQYVKEKWRDIVFVVVTVMTSAALAIAISSTGRANRAIDDSEDNSTRLNEYIACQALYNENLNLRTKALTDATSIERIASRALTKAQSDLVTSPIVDIPEEERTKAQNDQIAALFRTWQAATTANDKAIATADKERAEHPVPEPPSKVCGTPPTSAPKKND